MIHHLSIDIETFSSIPIGDAGAQRYTASDDFEILLFAYSVDGQPVQVIDLACGEKVPSQIISALTDPDYIKHAYNASFEFGCLSKIFGPMIPSQWRCTMVHGLYCGYTAGLDATGRALGLPEDKQKLSTGKALIKYFCTPCKPTKSNGGRTRNYPRHDPEKWQLFKEYNGQDVVAEMEIEHRLSEFPVPDEVQRQWETDLAINMRGVAVDMDFVHGALDIGEGYKAGLMEEAARLTGLSNPNSVPQLLGWLNQRLGPDEELDNLRKDTVSRVLDDGDLLPEVRRALQIRQELGKTSTKKYDAIEACVCPDGRVRGLLQFYGANRTGRFAGRLVQVQNLPRTYTEPIELARELVKGHDADALQVVYGSVSDTLSQLIRTAFVSSPGHVLVDADFSAIEARVISWLAGEQWRLEVFQTHGKIYEASASQMFSVPIELIKKGNPEYALRAKGKVAELALGYNGGPGALIAMGALDMGLTEEELPDIVRRWRTANSRISGLWYTIEDKVLRLLNGEGTQRINIKEYDPRRARENEEVMGALPGTFTNWFNNGSELVFRREHSRTMERSCMTIQLPSGRKLFYVDPQVGQNRWGKPSITYWGVNQTTKKWEPTETYGGKLTENIVQAIARDCLCYAIENLEAAGYPIVFHVHDECVIDIDPYADNAKMLEDVCGIMKRRPPWAQGLPLDAAGWVGDFFTKD